MTVTVAVPEPVDWSALVSAFAEAFSKIGDAFRSFARYFQVLLRALRRYGRGYSSPTPLGIDGHAYTRRLRARTRRKGWRR